MVMMMGGKCRRAPSRGELTQIDARHLLRHVIVDVRDAEGVKWRSAWKKANRGQNAGSEEALATHLFRAVIERQRRTKRSTRDPP